MTDRKQSFEEKFRMKPSICDREREKLADSFVEKVHLQRHERLTRKNFNLMSLEKTSFLQAKFLVGDKFPDSSNKPASVRDLSLMTGFSEDVIEDFIKLFDEEVEVLESKEGKLGYRLK